MLDIYINYSSVSIVNIYFLLFFIDDVYLLIYLFHIIFSTDFNTSYDYYRYLLLILHYFKICLELDFVDGMNIYSAVARNIIIVELFYI